MSEHKDLTPKRNAPPNTTATGGNPARPSNASLMKYREGPERYAAGLPTMIGKVAQFTVETTTQRILKEAQDRARAQLGFPLKPEVRAQCQRLAKVSGCMFVGSDGRTYHYLNDRQLKTAAEDALVELVGQYDQAYTAVLQKCAHYIEAGEVPEPELVERLDPLRFQIAKLSMLIEQLEKQSAAANGPSPVAAPQQQQQDELPPSPVSQLPGVQRSPAREFVSNLRQQFQRTQPPQAAAPQQQPTAPAGQTAPQPMAGKTAAHGDQVRHADYQTDYSAADRGKWSDSVNTEVHSVATEKPETAPGSARPADGLTEAHKVKQKHTQTDSVEDRGKFKHAGEVREPKVDNHGSAPQDKMRPRAELILFNREGIYAIDKGDYLLLPGGGIDDGEQPRDAVIRETLEEANRQAVNVEPAGVVEAVWPKDSDNDFWNQSDFDGERTYFFTGVDGGDAGITHDDLENFQIMPFNQALSRLNDLVEQEGQEWASRNNQMRRALVAAAKRRAKTAENLKPVKMAAELDYDRLLDQSAARKGVSRQSLDEWWAEQIEKHGLPDLTKTADAAQLMRRKQFLMVTPDGRVIVRRLPNRRFTFPEQGTGRPAPYEDPVRFVPAGGIPEEGYHGYELALHVGETPTVPEGFEALAAQDTLKELTASMGLAVNKPFRQLDRARLRSLIRFLKRRRRQQAQPVPSTVLSTPPSTLSETF